jgi:NAD+ diphosphatase
LTHNPVFPYTSPIKKRVLITLYAEGEISLDDTEIEDARWFTADDLPTLPGKISIARRLIDWFLAKQTTKNVLDK